MDCGFSFTHAAPVFQNFTLNYGVKRIDLGGKALTNYLKELVSYRALNVMDETFIMDDVKEKLCFVSLNVPRDLQIARFVSIFLQGWSLKFSNEEVCWVCFKFLILFFLDCLFLGKMLVKRR